MKTPFWFVTVDDVEKRKEKKKENGNGVLSSLSELKREDFFLPMKVKCSLLYSGLEEREQRSPPPLVDPGTDVSVKKKKKKNAKSAKFFEESSRRRRTSVRSCQDSGPGQGLGA